MNSRASAPERNFEAGDSVMVRDYRPNHSRWQPGCIQRRVGMKSYYVKVPGGSTAWRRHADQIVRAPGETAQQQQDPELGGDDLSVGEEEHSSSTTQVCSTQTLVRMDGPTLQTQAIQGSGEPVTQTLGERHNEITTDGTSMESGSSGGTPRRKSIVIVPTMEEKEPATMKTRCGRIVRKPVIYRDGD